MRHVHIMGRDGVPLPLSLKLTAIDASMWPTETNKRGLRRKPETTSSWVRAEWQRMFAKEASPSLIPLQYHGGSTELPVFDSVKLSVSLASR